MSDDDGKVVTFLHETARHFISMMPFIFSSICSFFTSTSKYFSCNWYSSCRDSKWTRCEEAFNKIYVKSNKTGGVFSARTACSRAVCRDLAFRIFWNSSDWTRRCSSRLLFSDGSSSSLPDEPYEKDNRMTTKPCGGNTKSNSC